MKKTLLLIILLPITLFAQRLSLQSPVRFLALGDSYTIGQSVLPSQNWPNQLKDSLGVRHIGTDTLRIIATTGWRTDNLLSAITGQGLDSGHFNLVSLLIGVNNQYQGVPLSQYIVQFPQLLDSAIRYAGGDTAHVFIVSIPDYAYTPFGISTGDTAMISMQIDSYNMIARQFADSFHIHFFNITPISRMGLAQLGLVDTIDGLHPSPLQYSEWVSLMLQYMDSNSIDTIAVVPGVLEIASSADIRIYPNPAKDILEVSSDRSEIDEICILNMLGETIIDDKIGASSSTLSLTGLSSGVYTLRIRSRDGLFLRRLIKE